MPRTRECDYCGADIEPGTGTMFVANNGTTTHFCSSKCENNADLGREARNLEWTEAGRGTTAAEDEAAEAVEAEAAAAEEADADADDEEVDDAEADSDDGAADEEADADDADSDDADDDEEAEEAEA